MLHLSRLAEEITWWSNPRFGFVRAADSFTTGSSMMPNKRNPDPAELVRGRAARIVGSLAGFLALLKGLPLAYQRDLQEDKPPLFEACATFEASLGVMAGMVGTLAVDRDAMRRAAAEGFTTATAVADALVRRGVPFREAHHVVGRLVGAAEAAGIALTDLGDAMIAAALAESRDSDVMGMAGDPTVPGELRAAATLDAALASCDVIGGTAPGRVAAALAAARARLDAAAGRDAAARQAAAG
jgi:argininosuccinate lyase